MPEVYVEDELCELCGEELGEDSGEFYNHTTVIVAHAQCGLDHGLRPA